MKDSKQSLPDQKLPNQKVKVALIFGGRSGEHEVSIASAQSVYRALDKSKYDVTLIGIDKVGRWVAPEQASLLVESQNPRLILLNEMRESVTLVPYESKNQLIPLALRSDSKNSEGLRSFESSMEQNFDVILPILHGSYGEDGTIQGLLELANIPYVGSGVLGSALGMDKDLSRKLFAAAGIPVVKTRVLKRHDFVKSPEKWIEKMAEEFSFPHFVKPVNAGSSLGVHKVKSLEEALAHYKDAFQYDVKVLVEQAVQARELEVSVLGNDEPKASVVGEIIPRHEFYSYEAKYIDQEGAELVIPATDLSEAESLELRNYAVLAFKAIECRGLARVDFFMDRQTRKIFLNEINTIPGFTSISMYPKLWEASGLKYPQLLEELISLAIESNREKNSLKTSYS